MVTKTTSGSPARLRGNKLNATLKKHAPALFPVAMGLFAVAYAQITHGILDEHLALGNIFDPGSIAPLLIASGAFVLGACMGMGLGTLTRVARQAVRAVRHRVGLCLDWWGFETILGFTQTVGRDEDGRLNVPVNEWPLKGRVKWRCARAALRVGKALK